MRKSWRFLAGVLVSRIGDSFSFMAVLLLLGELGVSKWWISFFLLARYAPAVLVGMCGRNLIGLLDKRKTLITCYAASAGLTFLLIINHSNPLRLLLLSVSLGFSYAFYVPLQKAWIIEIFGERDIRSANARVQMADVVAKSIGFLLAGMSYEYFGASFSFAIDSLSFAAIAVLFCSIHTESKKLTSVEAVRVPRPTSALAYISIVFGFAWIGTGVLFSLEANYARDYIGASASAVGILFSAATVGSLAAPWLIEKTKHFASPAVLAASALIEMLCVGTYALCSSFGPACVCIVGYGLLLTFRHLWIANRIHQTIARQQHVCSFAYQQAVANFAMLFGMGLSGPLADHFGTRITIVAAALVSAGLIVIALFSVRQTDPAKI